MTGKRPLWDELFQGFETAVADIRQKVVEEPWFGQAVTASALDQGPCAREPEPTLPAPTTGSDAGIDR
jgi:hypothetical protein